MRALTGKPYGHARLAWYIAVASLGLAIVTLSWQAGKAVMQAAMAIEFPLSLDYGEGIVVQQALMMGSGLAYGSIADLPFVVFHYPPAFHLVMLAGGAISGVSGPDLVIVGRYVSVLAALFVAGIIAMLAYGLAPPGLSRSGRWAVAVTALSVILCSLPFTRWMPLARVDLLSIALAMAGLALAADAQHSRAKLYGAVVLFVLSVFTKQTSIAAPLAATLVLTMADRRRGLEMIAAGVVLSVVLLGAVQWITQSGFLRHVVGYNLNRYQFERVLMFGGLMVLTQLAQLLVVGLTLSSRVDASAMSGVIGLAARLRSELRARRFALVLVHFALCTLLLALVGKSGSGVNYLLEWLGSLAVLTGIAFGQAILFVSPSKNSDTREPLRAALIGAILIVHALQLPPAHYAFTSSPSALAEARELIRIVQETNKPVISDDMILTLRAGQQVLWEPAIFAELASLGRWDEMQITDPIRSGLFSMAVTAGRRGDALFDSRYNPAVADAMDAVWPRKIERLGYTLHLPPEPDSVKNAAQQQPY